MSLSAELLFADIAEALGPSIYISPGGQGAPLLDALPRPPVRFAERSVGGFVQRGSFLAVESPLSLHRDRDVLMALGAQRAALVDISEGDADRLLEWVAAATPHGAAAIRVRSGECDAPGMTTAFQDRETGEAILVRGDLLSADLRARAEAYELTKFDEFDTFVARSRDSAIIGLEYLATDARVHFAPLTVLDQPDPQQIVRALTWTEAWMAADGGAALVLPQLSSTPTSAGFSLWGLDQAASLPRITVAASGWRVDANWVDGNWEVQLSPQGARPSPALLVEISGAGPEVELRHAWSSASRRRDLWEDWDEADAQLTLEESW